MPSVILNFHGVGPIPRKIDTGETNCWLERDHFEAVLDVVAHCNKVVLTVDDGNASDFEFVLPALLQRGLKATFFVCSGRLDHPDFLSGHQVRDLLTHGMAIGSHGIAHRPWRHLPSGQLHCELEDSRRILESVCRMPVTSAACPFGSYDRKVLRALRNAEYESVYTSDGGGFRDSDWLKARTTVTRSMSPQVVRNLVEHGPIALRRLIIAAKTTIKRLR